MVHEASQPSSSHEAPIDPEKAALALALFQAVTANARLEYDATHDRMTGLLNREGILRKVEERIQKGNRFGVLVVDADNLKQVNDIEGHQAGDLVVAAVSEATDKAAKIEGIIRKKSDDRPGDELGHAGRIGGDELLVVVDLSDPDTAAQRLRRTNLTPEDRLQTVSNRIVRGLEDRKYVEAMGAGVSVGSAIWEPGSPVTAQELVHSADLDMYTVKQAQKSGQVPPRAEAS